jgi:hypothetical protein
MGGMLALLRKEVMGLEQHPRNVRLQLESDALLKGVERARICRCAIPASASPMNIFRG